ncbi:TPA: hypothetical protein RTG66_001539 [Campylobacter jejuni]|nr:hypothetical protein [Campylobacter jejuni]
MIYLFYLILVALLNIMIYVSCIIENNINDFYYDYFKDDVYLDIKYRYKTMAKYTYFHTNLLAFGVLGYIYFNLYGIVCIFLFIQIVLIIYVLNYNYENFKEFINFSAKMINKAKNESAK